MATWTPRAVPIDVVSILLERTRLPEYTGDVYAVISSKDSKSLESDLEDKEALSVENLSIKKKNVFGEEITDREKFLIEQKVSQQQKKFQEYERKEYDKKASKIKLVFDFLVDKEIKFALKDNEDDVDEVISQFTHPDYLRRVRKKLSRTEPLFVTSKMNEEQKEAYESLVKRRNELGKNKAKKNRSTHAHSVTRLTLDLALKQMTDDPEAAFEGWSEARIKAFKLIEVNPNAYYYRFNAPGEVQRTGQWTTAERKLFFDRLREIGADGQWGIFSQVIPGRVGYQCSNFYRQLIAKKEVTDPNYVIEPNGKIRYLFSGKQSGTSDTKKTSRISIKEKGRARKRAKRRGDDSEEVSSDEEYTASTGTEWRTTSRTRKISEETANTALEEEAYSSMDELRFLNPLPGFIDPITLDEVVQPAISPYGHVMGYANWVRCLNSEGSRNVCPLTKQPLSKRDLVLLTPENIEKYCSKIING